jgi:hypothetical protein
MRNGVDNIGLPTLDAAVQAVQMARTQTEIDRAGYVLLAVVLLHRSDYNVIASNFEEDS